MSKYNVALNIEDRNSLTLLLKRIKSGSTVLEFGCANGRMTSYMKNEMGCRVYAVELDANAAKDAEPHTEKLIVGNIDTLEWMEEYGNIRFDYIIFADVLEHLYDPQKILTICLSLLKEEGSILVSVPNTAYNSIIIELINGQFTYRPTGLLDDTHIRFFTRQSFEKLAEKCGLHIAYESAVFLPPISSEFGDSYSTVPSQIASILKNRPDGEAYQLIYELRPKQCERITEYSATDMIDGKFFAQLFFDFGEGYSEENSVRSKVASLNTESVFTLDLPEGVSGVRFDCLNDSCIADISASASGRNLKALSSNALIAEDNVFYFDSQDPQIYYGAPTGKQLIFTVSFMKTGEQAAGISLKKCCDSVREKLTEIESRYLLLKIPRILKKIIKKIKNNI